MLVACSKRFRRHLAEWHGRFVEGGDLPVNAVRPGIDADSIVQGEQREERPRTGLRLARPCRGDNLFALGIAVLDEDPGQDAPAVDDVANQDRLTAQTVKER